MTEKIVVTCDTCGTTLTRFFEPFELAAKIRKAGSIVARTVTQHACSEACARALFVFDRFTGEPPVPLVVVGTTPYRTGATDATEPEPAAEAKP